jgi:hypothetical protein
MSRLNTKSRKNHPPGVKQRSRSRSMGSTPVPMPSAARRSRRSRSWGPEARRRTRSPKRNSRKSKKKFRASFINSPHTSKIDYNQNASADADAAMAPVANNKLPSIFRNIFDKVRDEIMRYGELDSEDPSDIMFLFKKPNQFINDFLFNLYQVNNIRNYLITQIIVKDAVSNISNKDLFMMISCLQFRDDTNTLYITSSEEPETQTSFYDKIGILLNMIKFLLIKSNNKNANMGDWQPGFRRNRIDKINENELCKLIISKGNHKIVVHDVTNKQYKLIQENEIYKSNIFDNYNPTEQKIPGVFYENNKPGTTPQPKQKHNPVFIKLPENLKIVYVFNNTYINFRKEGLSYPPFLKPDKNASGATACNSGSICSESKIFSYAHLRKKYTHIDGAIAVWIGNGLFSNNVHMGWESVTSSSLNCKDASNCQYHPKYCYGIKPSDINKLDKLNVNLTNDEKLSENLISALENSNLEYYSNSSKITTTNYLDNARLLFRHFALPCPGCTLNHNRYKHNSFIAWPNKGFNECVGEQDRKDDNNEAGRGIRTAARKAKKDLALVQYLKSLDA